MKMEILRALQIALIYLVYSCNGATLKCYRNRSLSTYHETPISNPISMINSGCLKTHLPTVIYTFGYQGRSDGPASRTVLKAFLESSEPRNIVLLDWEEESSSGLLGFAFGYAFKAAPNARMTGKALGDALVTLALAGLDLSNVHLIGHSLGAHLMGSAGRRAAKKGFLVGRITGLDPARALFEYPFAMEGAMLDKTCARFVDIIHTDPGNYGVAGSYGTIDFWPNYVEGKRQPGCEGLSGDVFSREDLCSHDRSWRYLAEAVRKPDAFMAYASNSLPDLRRSTSAVTLLGPYTDTKARGNYYFTTNPAPPFGRKDKGLQPPTKGTSRLIRGRRLIRNNLRTLVFGKR